MSQNSRNESFLNRIKERLFGIINKGNKYSNERINSNNNSENEIVKKAVLQERFVEAVKKGEIRIVEEILHNKSAKINLSDKYGNTSLHYACEYGHLEILNLLIRRHARLDAQNIQKRTALHVIAIRSLSIINDKDKYQNAITIIETLLKSGAETNYRDIEGKRFYDILEENLKKYIMSFAKIKENPFSSKYR